MKHPGFGAERALESSPSQYAGATIPAASAEVQPAFSCRLCEYCERVGGICIRTSHGCMCA